MHAGLTTTIASSCMVGAFSSSLSMVAAQLMLCCLALQKRAPKATVLHAVIV